jgi:SAM-dependent methyltransferase
VAKRKRKKYPHSADRQLPSESLLPEGAADGASVPEGSEDLVKAEQHEKSKKAVEPKEPDDEKKTRMRRSRAGVRCPVCGRSGESTGDTGRVRCGTCGAAFPRTRPALGEVAKARDKRFSRAFALPNSEERREARALAGEAMRGFFQVLKGKPAALNAFGKNVLEVNCGLGFRLRAFQSYGWGTTGTETSATAYEYARLQSLEVTHGWLGEGRFGTIRFDLALFCASFGEMDSPHKIVKQLRGLLVDHGLVCVLREPLVGEDASPSDDSRLFVHTPESIKRVFTNNKFTLVSEESAEGIGTFWFKSKTRRDK